jgi:diguanylate cyclase (GGDEF)-like protein
MSFDEALARITAQKSRLRSTLLPEPEFRREFTDLLREFGHLGLDLRVTVRPRGSTDELAVYVSPEIEPDKGEGSEKREVAPDERAVTSTVEAWYVTRPRPDASQVDACMRQLGELATLHWGDRDPMTLLPYLKSPGVEARVLNYANEASDRGQCIAVLNTDLDMFKSVNSEFGYEAGSAVLSEFGERFRTHFAELGVVIRHGGEEFSAVLNHADPVEILGRVEAFRALMEKEPLQAIGRPNTCSIGLSVYNDGDVRKISGSAQELVKQAEDAVQRAKEDGRNRIRLNKATEAGVVGSLSRSDLVQAALEARLDLDRPRSSAARGETGSILSNLIADRVLGSAAADAPSAAETVAKIVGVTFENEHEVADDRPPSLSFAVPIRIWATALASGYLRAAYAGGPFPASADILRFEVRDAGDGKRALVLVVDHGSDRETAILIAPVAPESVDIDPVAIGRPWYPQTQAPAGAVIRYDAPGLGSGYALSPCLLLPIGDNAIGLAKSIRHLVADIVEIDDRPVAGGGLPDFWQSNVSRTVRACLRNPNIQRIIVLGKSANAKATLARLDMDEDSWKRGMHDLQRRISISLEHLLVFRERKIGIERIEDPDPTSVCDAIFGVTSNVETGAATPATINLEEEAKRRRISVAPQTENIRLLPMDGLRTTTLTDAYPQAINLLRSSGAPFQIESSQRRFREFPTFKLVLTTPYVETVPDYWKSEKETLDDYVGKNFGRQDGLFGKPLHVETDGKPSLYRLGIDATVAALRAQRPTRRIFLPVSAMGARFDQPLGLCAIQVMPRFRGERCHLDFQWIWRTVEALVGFPFSAFGSISWSKEFYETVTTELLEFDGKANVELGELTYLALSFHMFLDEGDTEIARAIVQDVST